MSYWIFFVSFYSSLFTKNLLWIFLNGALIVTSYLSDIKINCSDSLSKYVDEMDYGCILLITFTYLDDVYTNTILLCAAAYEFYDKRTIVTIKNISCGLALIKCCICCFNLDVFIGINLVWFTIIGVHIYRARIVYYDKHKNYCDNLFYSFLTIIWRLCALIMLLSASYTMEKSFKNAFIKI